MGMAGGAYKGDMDRAKLALQAAQIANSRRAQELQRQHQREVLAEQARQANMADARANRALDIQAEGAEASRAYREAMLQERMRQNDVANGIRDRSVGVRENLAAARQMAQDRRLSALEGQNSVLGQFQQVVDTEKRQQAAKRAQGQAAMASLMKMAMANGGVAPMAAINFANRQFGFDGKTRAIGGAGFTQNGDWFVDFLQKDQNGQLSRQTSVMPFEQQGQVYYGQAGIFDNADRAAWRKRMLERKYSTQEVNAFSGLNATAIQGLDEAGLQRLEQGYADPVRGTDWKQELAFRKQQLAEYKAGLVKKSVAEALGLSSNNPALEYAFKRIEDRNFLEHNRVVAATEDDVKNGLAKNVGDMFRPTREYLLKREMKFYNDYLGGEDPATSAAGRDPAVVSAQGRENVNPPLDENGNPPDGNENLPDRETPPPEENTPPPGDSAVPAPEQPGAPEQPQQPAQPQQPEQPGGEQPIRAGAVNPPEAPSDQPEQQEFDFGGGGAPAEGGEGGAPAEGGEGGAPAGGGEGGGEEGGGAPPPPPRTDGGSEEPQSNGMAAGALNAEQLETERKRKKWQSRVRRR